MPPIKSGGCCWVEEEVDEAVLDGGIHSLLTVILRSTEIIA
jgi:hypothetical protein